MVVGLQRHAPAALPLEREVVPIVQEAGWAPGHVWKRAEILTPPLGLDPRTLQPVACRYTDYGNPAHTLLLECCKSYGGFMHESDVFFTISATQNILYQ